jgi:type 2 lantibiotic biosynthesis protein LanM
MDSSVFALPDWFKALTLSERAVALRRSPQRFPIADEALAARRLARWRGQDPFSTDDFFTRRLAQDGLTEDDLRTLLAEPAEAIAARESGRPEWLLTLEKAFTQPASESFPEPPPTSPSIGFVDLVRPLLDRAYSRLLAGLREIAARHPGAPADPEIAGPLLAANLPSFLVLLMSRTLVVDLQVARQEGRLAGETPEERFQSFVEGLREPETALTILRQYPVLARGLVGIVDRWLAVSLEILRRLAADWNDLRGRFAPDADPGPLVEVRTGLGDAHRGGRTVTLFRFESGLRLIYKPKPLGVERAFQDLLDWTARKGFEPGFRTLRLIDRGDYGWIEFIEALPCADEAAVRRFYQRQGAYIALLWLLEATDFHWENLIAAGEHPVLIDLEALFQPLTDELGSQADETRVGRVLRQTVLTIGLLPSRVWAEGGGEGVDLSGLAGTGGQAAPPVLMPEGAGTDGMRYTLQPVELPAGDNLPILQGEAASVTRFIDEVVDGFERMMRLLQEHKAELAAAGGPLDAFREAEVRVIVRPTRNYALLFFESYHPYMVSDALDRDRLIDRLWLAAREHSLLERLIPAERGDLLRGDIPMFLTRPGTRDIWSVSGERFADLQPDSGLDRVRRRLERLDGREIGCQSWLVRNSLATLDLTAGGRGAYDFRETAAPSREELLAAAVKIGRRLEAIALQGPNDAHWFAPQTLGPGGSTTWVLQSAKLDLHLGVPGIALFLAWLGKLTGEARFTALARAAVVTLRDQLEHGHKLLSNIGAYSGWGGVVWTLTHLGVLWGDEELLDEAERIALEEIPALIPLDENNDLVAGASGCLISLLTLHEVRSSDRLLEAAVRCGERLLARALPMKQGLGWHLKIAGPIPLPGLSHGVAGIAWPLLRLSALTGDLRFRETALAGLEYERSLYHPDERNWPDLREGARIEGSTESRFMWAWCHGAPGVGLGRLAALPYLDDARVREEIEIAVEATIERGFGGNHCLCHGDLGNLELLTLAAERLERPDWAERADRISGGILSGIRETGWLYGIPGTTETPGMMVGLAGIGYGLLRRAAPERVPSVLILEGSRR